MSEHWTTLTRSSVLTKAKLNGELYDIGLFSPRHRAMNRIVDGDSLDSAT